MPHSYGRDCLDCGEPGSHTDCSHRRYSRKVLRFVEAHLEAYEAAYTNGDGRAASGEMKRLDAELRLLPSRHDCTCPVLNRRTGTWSHHCVECRRIDQSIQQQEYPADMGRSSPVNAPMPSTLMLDYFSGYMGGVARDSEAA